MFAAWTVMNCSATCTGSSAIAGHGHGRSTRAQQCAQLEAGVPKLRSEGALAHMAANEGRWLLLRSCSPAPLCCYAAMLQGQRGGEMGQTGRRAGAAGQAGWAVGQLTCEVPAWLTPKCSYCNSVPKPAFASPRTENVASAVWDGTAASSMVSTSRSGRCCGMWAMVKGYLPRHRW